MKRITSFSKKIVTFISVFSFVIALLLSTIDVFSRLSFNAVFLWINPFSQYLFVTSGLFAFLLTIEKNEMLQISLLKKIQNNKIVFLLLKLTCILTSLIFIFIFAEYHLKILKNQSFPISELIYKIPYLFWSVFMFIFFIDYRVFEPKIENHSIEEVKI